MIYEQPDAMVELAIELFNQGNTTEEITAKLRSKEANENQLQQALAAIKALRITKRRNKGFIWCGIGCFLLVAGCMLTFIQHSNGQSIRLALYGFTTIGVGILLKGLVDVFGW